MTWSGWGASGGIVERVGLESARGGVEAEALYDSIRVAARLAQAEVHRAVLLAPQHLDPEAVLGLPVAADALATTLRPLMADVDCIVGPAVPITEFPDSLAMGQRLSALRAVAHSGPTFVDDSLLELVCVADRSPCGPCGASTSESSTGCRGPACGARRDAPPVVAPVGQPAGDRPGPHGSPADHERSSAPVT